MTNPDFNYFPYGCVTVDAQTGKHIPDVTYSGMVKDPAGREALIDGASNDDGYLRLLVPVNGSGTITFKPKGNYQGAVLNKAVFVDQGGVNDLVKIEPAAQTSPWLTITIDELRKWNGAIATILAPVPRFGPRPGDPTNVLFTAEVINPAWSDAEFQQQLAWYTRRDMMLNPPLAMGYASAGEGGQRVKRYPDTNLLGNFSVYEDKIEAIWRAGKVPIPALCPDCEPAMTNNRLNRQWILDNLVPLWRRPRFQAMGRKFVGGWELNLNADDSRWLYQLIRQEFVNAVVILHGVSNHGAPCWQSDLVSEGGTFTEATAWMNVMPFLDGYGLQDTFTFTGDMVEPARVAAFGLEKGSLVQFIYDLQDFAKRLTDPTYRPEWSNNGQPLQTMGYRGWFDLNAAEWGSMSVFSDPGQKARSDSWGAAAMGSQDPTIDYDGAVLTLKGRLAGFNDGSTQA